jgi:ribosomal protein S18 acetylase RimI-like enzyme
VVVRLYRNEDREAVHRLAADTAFFGAPVEAYLPDRQLFSDLFTAYYTDREPEHLWVADVDGRVAGYFAGSLGGGDLTAGRLRSGARAAEGLVLRRYRDLGGALQFLRRLAAASLRGEYPSPSLEDYPAHLHINVDETFRGQGLGGQLMRTGLAGMAAAGAKGIYLHTTSYNAAAVTMYEKLGFKLLGSRVTHLWEPWLPGVKIENLVFGKLLQSDARPEG